MKKWIAFLMTALMLASMCVGFAGNDVVTTTAPIAPAPETAKTVSLRVEGMKDMLYFGDVELQAEDTVFTVLERALQDAKVELVAEDGQYGKYIKSIGGELEGTFGVYDGWMYFVDDQTPMVGMDAYKLNGGESILVGYGAMDTRYPIFSAVRGEDGLVTLTAEADVTDWSTGSPVTSRKPIDGAELTVAGVKFTTDANGKAVLSAELSAKQEAVSVQIAKYSEAGLPLVYRFAPDFALDLAKVEKAPVEEPLFPDVADDAWYAAAVKDMVARKAVNGIDGKFLPMQNITRGEVVMILYRLAGGVPVNYAMDFADVKEGDWYAEGVRWAASLGVVTGADGKFLPGNKISRQDLAVMLTRYQEKVVKTELKQDAEAPAFADNAKIAAYASEAVYTLQKAGVVNGADGKFNPLGTATRAELCQMVSKLLAA